MILEYYTNKTNNNIVLHFVNLYFKNSCLEYDTLIQEVTADQIIDAITFFHQHNDIKFHIFTKLNNKEKFIDLIICAFNKSDSKKQKIKLVNEFMYNFEYHYYIEKFLVLYEYFFNNSKNIRFYYGRNIENLICVYEYLLKINKSYLIYDNFNNFRVTESFVLFLFDMGDILHRFLECCNDRNTRFVFRIMLKYDETIIFKECIKYYSETDNNNILKLIQNFYKMSPEVFMKLSELIQNNNNEIN
jgi:hypothetical protein